MVRTQVQLSEEQAESLRRLAAERRKSIAAVIREAVDLLLGEDDRKARIERALAVGGRYSSGTGDVSEKHDEYFAEAVLDDIRR
jgi:Arc/MetJ-type ribon-helix-helix transcriptional regulator